jgi:subtilase family serine protease
MRSNPDVAYDADPATGFAVYDTFDAKNGNYVNKWFQVGGTSAGAPQWASIISIADQQRVAAKKKTLDGRSQVLPAVYNPANASAFSDITLGASTGSPNYSAKVGYDLATGIGSPKVDILTQVLLLA